MVTTKYVGDNGIDLTCSKSGIDPQGLDTMNYYVQAKRYKSTNKVQAKEIRDLKGSTKRDKQGNVLNNNYINVFITTSSFTKGAIDEAESNPNMPTILIDGKTLLNMCIDNGIAFSYRPVFDEDLLKEILKQYSQPSATIDNKARFSRSKKELKEAYDTYVDGLSAILETFAKDISNTFNYFRENWKVEFIVPKNSETFRDLISEDVHLSLDDNGSIGVLDKGAGLQRLATILLNFEMLSRINKRKSIVVCIDEPDAYLHEGLQRKLKALFDEKSSSMQLFFTTHSKVFINEYNMRNVFLLDSKYYEQYCYRRCMNRDVIVQGNPRVYKALKNELAAVLQELQRIESGSDVNDELLNIIELIAEILGGLKGEDNNGE